MLSKSPKLTPARIKAFQSQICAFYRHSGRHNLPWRKTKNPYKILISEVMLQQTQVARVLRKYPEFLEAFSTIETLANAPLSEVLRVWQGMGYNRRARYLRDTAQKIVVDFKGRIPKTEEELCALPGVGYYTANAILTFAHDESRVFIETNIRRVFIHHFFGNKRVATGKISDEEIKLLVEQTLDHENPCEWYYALMDYGTHLPRVIRKNPNTQSKHYVSQSTFKGSFRELRGKIIRILSEEPKTLIAVKREINNNSRTKEALDALIKDMLITYEKRKYKLA